MVPLPKHWVLNYSYDNDGGCALTALVNGERLHVTVDVKELQDRSKAGKQIRREYQNLLYQVQAEASGEVATHQTAPLFVQEDEADSSDDEDSGVDVRSPSHRSNATDAGDQHDAGPSQALQRWILKPIISSTSSRQNTEKRTVQDWYFCPTRFYHLTISCGKLSAVEDEPSPSLNKRIDQLVPTINLPKYIQKLNVPRFAASEITVLAEDEGPADQPIRPTLVEFRGKEYFLKAVNNAEPGPTKREIQVMKKIEQEGLEHELRVPLLRGLVHFDGDDTATRMMGFLLDAICEPTPLTTMLDSSVPAEKRRKWAEESARMVDVLHQHHIVWGDAKGMKHGVVEDVLANTGHWLTLIELLFLGDNFMVDKNGDLFIIDFGGSYTEGWVDPELMESEEGDNQGVRRLVNGLADPEHNTIAYEEDVDGDESKDVDGDEREDVDVDENEEVVSCHENDHPESLKRKHPDSSEEEQVDAHARVAKQQKQSEDNVRIPFETETTTVAAAANDDDDETDEVVEQEEAAQYCYCNTSESGGPMIACDGEQCEREWFHFKCVGIDEAPKEKQWYCDDCL